MNFPLNEHTYVEAVEKNGISDNEYLITLSMPIYCGKQDDFIQRSSSAYMTKDKMIMYIAVIAQSKRLPCRTEQEYIDGNYVLKEIGYVFDPIESNSNSDKKNTDEMPI
tara:strand:+ start:169 stop:495 length:327 start_codon:yes stop_codon:yes gene_type:complete